MNRSFRAQSSSFISYIFIIRGFFNIPWNGSSTNISPPYHEVMLPFILLKAYSRSISTTESRGQRWKDCECWGRDEGKLMVGAVGGEGGSSSCLLSSGKSQISYRDDGWSGCFHPAQHGCRRGMGIRSKHPPPTLLHHPTSSPSRLLSCPLQSPSSRPLLCLSSSPLASPALALLKRCHMNTKQLLRTAAIPRDWIRVSVRLFKCQSTTASCRNSTGLK